MLFVSWDFKNSVWCTDFQEFVKTIYRPFHKKIYPTFNKGRFYSRQNISGLLMVATMNIFRCIVAVSLQLLYDIWLFLFCNGLTFYHFNLAFNLYLEKMCNVLLGFITFMCCICVCMYARM